MRKEDVRAIALGGVLAGVAVVIMCLGGMLYIATYACPMLCTILTSCVLTFCGKRIVWVWYVAVAILSMLLCPDKEAAAIYLVLGYYPIIRPFLERLPFCVIWKLLIFNTSILLVYGVLMQIMGMTQLQQELGELGAVMLFALLIMGNAAFFLLDLLLGRFSFKRAFGRKGRIT